ncbi:MULTISPECIES: O-antigen translocase [Sphingobacterium]|uniref:O-antigen translocase n=1 Tax=Sphingobacterium TaxID=28453 RepID=UPI0013DCBE55|nr:MULTISPECIES: O-antigen translocase [unclassified Sphingobacterium]
MRLVKTALFSSLITVVKTITGFVSTKVVASVIGPAGVAAVGAFVNFIAIISTFANGGITNGIVKYTSEYSSDVTKTKELFSTSLKISIYASIFIGAVLILGADLFSRLVFASNEYNLIIVGFGASVILYSLNTLLISILNGKGLIPLYSFVNIIGSVFGLLLTIILVFKYNVKGALISMILVQSVIFFLTLGIIWYKTDLKFSLFKADFNYSIAKNLSKFSIMAMVAALTAPVAQIVIRNSIVYYENTQQAGIWQGMLRISDAYLLVFNTALATYYLPKLAKIDGKELKCEIKNGYRLVLPFTIFSAALIFIMRDFIIHVLYSKDFYEMRYLFLWQLVGDVFKISAFILAYVMLAKANLKIYIFSEIFFSIIYVVLSLVLINSIGTLGATIAFAINYFLYCMFMVFYYRDLLFR